DLYHHYVRVHNLFIHCRPHISFVRIEPIVGALIVPVPLYRMGPSTILSIVPLSAAVLKLGSTISYEFFRHNEMPEKLRLLNAQLQLFNSFLEEVLRESGVLKTPSRFDYPGTESITEALEECKEFLEHYKTKLSTRRRYGEEAQRTWPLTGPDSPQLEDFHKRIDRHYVELQHWTMRVLQTDLAGLQSSMSTRAPLTMVEASNGETLKTSFTRIIPLQISPQIHLIPEPPSEMPTADASPLSNRVPGLRPSSRVPSIASIPELPPSAFPDRRQSFSLGRHRPGNTSSIAGPVTELLSGRGHDGAGINLYIGKRGPWEFVPDNYKLSKLDEAMVVEWLRDRRRIKHYIPRGTRGIPFTKPNDSKLELSFLPRGSKHQFEIIDGTTIEIIRDIPKYQFSHKSDWKIFQRRVRARAYLEIIPVVRIHREAEINNAMGVHLKVWGGVDLDNEPTLSFADLGESQFNSHVEYKLCWFKTTPELRGVNRVILWPHPPGSDLEHRPQPQGPGRPASTIGPVAGGMPWNPNQSMPSRSQSISAPPAALYQCKGVRPSGDVRALGYLEIEFENSELRDDFLRACFEAHHPGSRTPRGNTSVSDSLPSTSLRSTPSQPKSCTSSSDHTLRELEGDMEIHTTPPTSIRPWPSSEEVHHNALSPFALPQPAIQELEALEVLKADVEGHHA
ncbi:hypothetical protein F4779DRAFT_643372, partial [Xylariaceae sp. FL0662B]